MNAPTKITIGHLVWEIKFGSPTLMEETKQLGLCDKTRQIIILSPDLPPRLMADVALHEALHGIFFSYSIGDEVKEEDVASRLSGPLLLLMQQNPAFWAWLQFLMRGGENHNSTFEVGVVDHNKDDERPF